jgi:Ala-tRNA(Pro) deacylase
MINIRFIHRKTHGKLGVKESQAEVSRSMLYVSEVHTTAPGQFHTQLQRQTYKTLAELRIPFMRVDTDEAITMGDCAAIEERLGMRMVKTLFLCNRQQTEFYLFIMAGDKPFRAKEFSAALGVARVSFAPAERMEAMLGTKIGAATVFSCLLDRENRLRIVFDRDVATAEWYGCSDGTTTGYLKLRTDDVCRVFLPFTNHALSVIEV